MGLKESEVGIIIHYFLEILYLGYVLERIDLYNCRLFKREYRILYVKKCVIL
jgi:hypothetical protein